MSFRLLPHSACSPPLTGGRDSRQVAAPPETLAANLSERGDALLRVVAEATCLTGEIEAVRPKGEKRLYYFTMSYNTIVMPHRGIWWGRHAEKRQCLSKGRIDAWESCFIPFVKTNRCWPRCTSGSWLSDAWPAGRLHSGYQPRSWRPWGRRR